MGVAEGFGGVAVGVTTGVGVGVGVAVALGVGVEHIQSSSEVHKVLRQTFGGITVIQPLSGHGVAVGWKQIRFGEVEVVVELDWQSALVAQVPLHWLGAIVKPIEQDPGQGAKLQSGGSLLTYVPSGHCFTSSVQAVAASGLLVGTFGATGCCLSW